MYAEGDDDNAKGFKLGCRIFKTSHINFPSNVVSDVSGDLAENVKRLFGLSHSAKTTGKTRQGYNTIQYINIKFSLLGKIMAQRAGT